MTGLGEELDRAARRLGASARIDPAEARAVGDRFLEGEPPTAGRPSGERCPHGDPYCPCQDLGDPCHYEGPSQGPWGVVEAMECPRPTPSLYEAAAASHPARLNYPHCHVEGCGWASNPPLEFESSESSCGLGRLGERMPPWVPTAGGGLDEIRGTPWWACGLRRWAAQFTYLVDDPDDP